MGICGLLESLVSKLTKIDFLLAWEVSVLLLISLFYVGMKEDKFGIKMFKALMCS